jgi:hypothetical protein
MANMPFHLIPYTNATKPLKLETGPQLIAIDAILLRREEDSRPLLAKHVLEVAESIAVLGLIEPLVIDTNGYLLAGGHRLAAIQLLARDDDQERSVSFNIHAK